MLSCRMISLAFFRPESLVTGMLCDPWALHQALAAHTHTTCHTTTRHTTAQIFLSWSPWLWLSYSPCTPLHLCQAELGALTQRCSASRNAGLLTEPVQNILHQPHLAQLWGSPRGSGERMEREGTHHLWNFCWWFPGTYYATASCNPHCTRPAASPQGGCHGRHGNKSSRCAERPSGSAPSPPERWWRTWGWGDKAGVNVQTSLLYPPLHQNDNYEKARMTFRESHQHSQAGKHGVMSNGVQTSMDTEGTLSQWGHFLPGKGQQKRTSSLKGCLPARVTDSPRQKSLPSDGNKDFWTPHHQFTSQGFLPCSQEYLEYGRAPLPVSPKHCLPF